MIEVIVFDLYGTIAQFDSDTNMRNGLEDFFNQYVDKKFALYTDVNKKKAIKSLKSLGLYKKFDKLYTHENLIAINGCKCKNLGEIVGNYGVEPNEILLISDADAESAIYFGVNYVKVPYCLSIDEKFSFDMIEPDKINLYLDLSEVNK